MDQLYESGGTGTAFGTRMSLVRMWLLLDGQVQFISPLCLRLIPMFYLLFFRCPDPARIVLPLSVFLALVFSSLVSTLLPSKTSTTMNCDWLC